MAAISSYRRRAAVWAFAVLSIFAAPGLSSAQTTSSTVSVAFDRVGVPGTETLPLLDPISGNAVLDPATGAAETFTRDTGALLNPCLNTFTDLRGTLTLSITTVKTSTGAFRVSVTDTTRADGAAWTSPDNFVTLVPSGVSYTLSDTQQFTASTVAGQAQASDFTDRLTLRGSAAADRWNVSITSRMTIDAAGHPSVTVKQISVDPSCKA